jgi:hypothetical protein
MTKIAITRTSGIELTPILKEVLNTYLLGIIDGANEADKKAWRRVWVRINRLEVGEICNIEFVFPRNPKFHKKFFALLNFAFDAWEPDRIRKQYKGHPVRKNFERFRSDVIIQAGYYEQTFDLDGNMKLEAQSISFGSMDDIEFERVYSAVADVILGKVLTTYNGRDELDQVMGKMVGFL